MTPSLPWFSDLRYVVHANVSDYFLHFSPSLQCSQHSGPLYLLGHIYLFFKSFLLLLNYSCPLFSQCLSSALVTPLPTFKLCCPCPQVLYTCSLAWSLSFFPPLSPFLLLCGHCQFVLYFHVSSSILLICLFCWLGSTYWWDHMVFVFHLLAYFN